MMEPWDGPASIVFTDGRQIGATLDRNGLRPSRYCVTDDDLVIMASEAGVLPFPNTTSCAEVAPAAGQDVPDRPGTGPHHRRRGNQAPRWPTAKPYKQWIENLRIKLDDRGRQPRKARRPAAVPLPTSACCDRQQAFGYTQEDIKFLMSPMALTGEEATGSMGNDSPAGRARRPRTSRCTTTSSSCSRR